LGEDGPVACMNYVYRGYDWQARVYTGSSASAVPRSGEDGPAGALMKYVYLLESVSHPEQSYVGLTDNLRSRFVAHNAGQSPHTAKFKPWRLVTYVAFSDEKKAVAFERYLKSASGRAFAKKRLK
jgi:putative endonuclease